MQQLKKILKSPWALVCIIGIKMITYYSLIKVAPYQYIFMFASIWLIVLAFIGFGKSKLKYSSLYFLLCYAFITGVMFSDTMYYNYYNQTVSIKQLWQAANVAKVPESFIATLIPASFIMVVEVPVVFYYFKRYAKQWSEKYVLDTKKWKKAIKYSTFFLLFIAINPFQIKSMDRMNSVEFFSNHINDIVYSLLDDVSYKKVEDAEVLQQVSEVTTSEPEILEYTGIAQGKNLIVIQVESLQNFVIGATYNNQEITPNLNKLLEKDTFYFERYYSNIGKGNTVDAEFSTLNSLYPSEERECYSLYQDNTFYGLPWVMRELGYHAFAIHGYESSFWNREKAYPAQGFEAFYSQEDLDSEECIGLGISDKSMFSQSIDILKKQSNPYFSFIITLTNHHPYILEDKDCDIELLEEDKGTAFGKYLETVRYTDEAIGMFIEQLKQEGLYDNTVIAIYGDHHGLNKNMEENQETVSRFLGKEYDYDEMFRVPLIINVPGSNVKETISTVGGQIDFLPTIANLFGITLDNPYILGQDLINAKTGFVAFTVYLFEGSFISEDVMFEISRERIFEDSRCIDLNTGKELEVTSYKKLYEKAINLKEVSKGILEENLIKEYVTNKKK